MWAQNTMPSVDYEIIPPTLAALDQWVCWRLETREGASKPTKVPYCARNGRHAQSTNPLTWSPLSIARQAHSAGSAYDGVGFVFREGDGICGIDIDHVLSADGEIEDWAGEILDRFGATYAETSPSGTGLRIFARGAPIRCGKGTDEKRLELYDYTSPRYLTVTGRRLGSAVDVAECPGALEWLHARYFQPRAKPAPVERSRSSFQGSASDQQILNKALKNAKFAGLHSGDWSQYPSQSEADAAFCQSLAFWFGGDAERMDRVFRASGLMREKWDQRRGQSGTYGERTIAHAIGQCQDFYNPNYRTSVGPMSSAVRKTDGGGSGDDYADFERRIGVEPPDFGPPDDEPPSGDEDDKPLIKIVAGERIRVVDESETAVLSMPGDPSFYQRGGDLVRIVRIDHQKDDAATIKRSAAAPVIKSVSPTWLTERFHAAANYVKWDARQKIYRPADLPKPFAEQYLERVEWRAPVLKSLISAPLVRPDGSIFAGPGYDPLSSVFLASDCDFDIPGPGVTPAAVKTAVKMFHDLLDSFSFEHDHDFSAVVAMILTALMRPSLGPCPLFAIRAPTPGSGKTLIGRLASIIATGRDPAVMNHVADENEFRKRIFSSLLAGDPIVFIDNIEATLKSDLLCLIATSEQWTDRVLSESRNVSVSTAVTWILTGNNLHVYGDLTRRLIPVDIDPKCERPYERRFDRKIDDHVKANRADYIHAALTLIRGFFEAGRPNNGGPNGSALTLGSFERWNDWVRCCCVWAGLADPCAGLGDWESTDRVRVSLGNLLRAWRDRLGESPYKAAELIKHAENDAELQEALEEVAADARGRITSRGLGRYLAQYERRIDGGLMLVRTGTDARAFLYKVVEAKNAVI